MDTWEGYTRIVNSRGGGGAFTSMLLSVSRREFSALHARPHTRTAGARWHPWPGTAAETLPGAQANQSRCDPWLWVSLRQRSGWACPAWLWSKNNRSTFTGTGLVFKVHSQTHGALNSPRPSVCASGSGLRTLPAADEAWSLPPLSS